MFFFVCRFLPLSSRRLSFFFRKGRRPFLGKSTVRHLEPFPRLNPGEQREYTNRRVIVSRSRCSPHRRKARRTTELTELKREIEEERRESDGRDIRCSRSRSEIFSFSFFFLSIGLLASAVLLLAFSSRSPEKHHRPFTRQVADVSYKFTFMVRQFRFSAITSVNVVSNSLDALFHISSLSLYIDCIYLYFNMLFRLWTERL